MRLRLLYLWDSLRTSYWFVPAVMSLAAAGIAAGAIALDRTIHDRALAESVWWIYTGGPEGARAVLSTIAGSMITVAGVVFSITIVALSLASGQFGPRLLRNFMRDRSNQIVLGTFTGTYIYCLLVLLTVRGAGQSPFVPGAAVAVGIVLALASLGVLIYFIHHVAMAIQASQVIAAVSQEMRETIDRLWPDELGYETSPGRPAEPSPLPAEFDSGARPIAAAGSGYIAAIEDEKLMKLACDRDVIVKLIHRPGHFVIAGSPLAAVWPGIQVDEALTTAVNEVFLLELQRTPYQDLEFTVDQLVEVAVRALSPGVNDPFTAMTCIDWLGEALGRLSGRSIPSPFRYDAQGKVRVMTDSVSFADVSDSAFDQIRHYGRGSPAVLIHLLDTLEAVSDVARREADRDALVRHARLIRQACDESIPEAADRREIEKRFLRLSEKDRSG